MYTRPRKRDASRKTRAAIMDAVRELLEEGTFHETTVEGVAARAGVSRATLYQHFGTRLGLVDAICETFDKNPALVAIRETDDVDRFLELVVEFCSSEEKILVQLYGAAAVDPAARALVERQRRDRLSEVRRLLKGRPKGFAEVSLLTSFETYIELRRTVGLSKREVVSTLQRIAKRALR